MDNDRFIDLAAHPMFRERPKRDRRVAVDERFGAMLTAKEFAEKSLRVFFHLFNIFR
jgi:hypothetical protein